MPPKARMYINLIQLGRVLALCQPSICARVFWPNNQVPKHGDRQNRAVMWFEI